MEYLGNTLREHAPREGMLHNASQTLADSLASGGRYLQQHGIQNVGQELTNLIRRNPIPALLVGCGIGFLLSRVIRR